MKHHFTQPLGRTHEVDVGRKALQHARHGSGTAVVLHGEPGIGKTTVLDELVRVATALGLRPMQARANQLEANKPFGVLTDAFRIPTLTDDPRISNLARLLRKPSPEDFGPSDAQLPFRIVDELVETIDRFSAEEPMVLAIDDAGWIDDSSVMALERLSDRLNRLPLVLILSGQPQESQTDHRQFEKRLLKRGATHIVLTGLDITAQTDVVRQILRAEPDHTIMSSLSAAKGNPLYLMSLLEDMTAQGIIGIDSGEARLARPYYGPSSLEETILINFKRLSRECQWILKVGSVLGCMFTADDLAILFNDNAASLLPFLDEAYEAGVLVEAGSQLSFSHDLVRNVVYNDTPSSVRRALHADAARQLSKRGASAFRVASHYSLGASPGDREAVTWLRRAAGETCAQSAQTAVRFLENALILSEDSLQVRTEILAQMLNILALTGDAERAERLAMEVLCMNPQESLALRVKRDLARALWRQGRSEEAAKLLQQVTALKGLSDRFRARLLAESAYLAVKYHAGPDLSTALALEARALGKRSGDSVAVGMALHVLGRKAWWKGRFARGAAFQAKAISIAEEDAQEVQYFTPHQHLALCLIELDRFQEAEAVLETGMGMVFEIGERAMYLHQYHAIYGYLYTLTGRWQDAATRLETHISIGKGRKAYREAFEAALSISVYLAIHTDDLGGADRLISQRPEAIDKVVIALFQSARGNPEAARSELAALDRHNLSHLPIYRRLVWPEAAKLAIAVGLPAVAGLFVEQIERLSRLNRVPSADAALLRTRGLIENSLELLEAAVFGYAESERAFESASVKEEAAVAANGTGAKERAKELLLAAIDGYEQVGATRDLRRSEAFARDLGITRGVRSRRQHAVRGWESLTKTERKVLAMISEGLSNKRIAERLFISRRTAETHVMHILRKLGLKSRAQAAAAAAKVAEEANRLPDT